VRVALVCIAKNETNYIEEWVTYHLKLGFDKIFIYENNWVCDYENEQIVKIKFNGNQKQLESYKNFKTKYRLEYDWAAFFDVDEFLVLKKHKNIKEFLIDYDKYDSVGINWVLFGDNGFNGVFNNNYSVLNRFTKRQNVVNPHIKTIAKLNNDSYFLNPHCLNTKWVDTNFNLNLGFSNLNGPLDVAQINHYFTKTKEEFLEKINRGRADTKNYRSIDDFNKHNYNDIDDFYALNFYYS